VAFKNKSKIDGGQNPGGRGGGGGVDLASTLLEDKEEENHGGRILVEIVGKESRPAALLGGFNDELHNFGGLLVSEIVGRSTSTTQRAGVGGAFR